MSSEDPSAENDVRDRTNYAVGLVSQQLDLTTVEAAAQIFHWALETRMAFSEVVDLVVVGARVRDEHDRGREP